MQTAHESARPFPHRQADEYRTAHVGQSSNPRACRSAQPDPSSAPRAAPGMRQAAHEIRDEVEAWSSQAKEYSHPCDCETTVRKECRIGHACCPTFGFAFALSQLS